MEYNVSKAGRLHIQLDRNLEALTRHPLLWITIIWLAFVLPGITIRGGYFEEQTVIGLARGALEDHWWLAPHLYGNRFVERPVLLSWLIAVLSWPFGSVLVPIARLPTAISGLAGAFLLYAFVKPRTSVVGGAVAALCFIASPIVFQDAYVAEPDLMLSVLMFPAFVLWWNGEERDQITPLRWTAIALILTVAVFVKGPQPLAFFFVGMFAYYLVIHRDWRRIAGLIASGFIPAAAVAGWYLAIYQPGDIAIWQGQSRLHFWRGGFAAEFEDLLEFAGRFLAATLPCIVIIAAGWRLRADRSLSNRSLLAALLLYAVPCILLVWFWPGGRYRYALPAVPALAAAAGILFDQMRSRGIVARYLGLTVIVVLICFQAAFNWLIMTAVPDVFAKSRIAAHSIAAAMATQPATLYAINGAADNNILTYLPPPIRRVAVAELAQIAFPAWILATASQQQELQASRPDLRLQSRLVLAKYSDARLLYVDRP